MKADGSHVTSLFLGNNRQHRPICAKKHFFLGKESSLHIYGYNMANKVAVSCWFCFPTSLLSSVGLHVDYIINAVGHTCVM